MSKFLLNFKISKFSLFFLKDALKCFLLYFEVRTEVRTIFKIGAEFLLPHIHDDSSFKKKKKAKNIY